MTRHRTRSLAGVVAGVLLVLTGVTPAPSDAEPRVWHTTVFAHVPAPGYPAYVFVGTDGHVYAGSYEAGDRAPSKVFEWSGTGRLLRSWTVPGQRLDAKHGVQVANQTRDGELVLLETSTRSVLTLDVHTGRFHHVATFPEGSIPNYATWGPRDLFVSDYGAGVIWRVLPSGRVQRWFSSPALKGVLGFGTAGIVYRARQHDLLITQQTVGDGSTLPTNGHLYRLPVDHGRPGRLSTLWTSNPVDLPDGFAVGRSGRIYIAQSGLNEQLVELSATGHELGRFPQTPGTGANGSPIPFDTPSSATFLGTSLLVANQSVIQRDASHQAILEVDVGEQAMTPHLPRSAMFGH